MNLKLIVLKQNNNQIQILFQRNNYIKEINILNKTNNEQRID